MIQGKEQKLMEDRDLGPLDETNPQCFPQNMRKGLQKPFTWRKPAPKARIRVFAQANGTFVKRKAQT